MSTLNAMRRHLRQIEERDEPPAAPRIGRLALVLLLLLGLVAGAAELRLVPAFSADDAGSIVFALG